MLSLSTKAGSGGEMVGEERLDDRVEDQLSATLGEMYHVSNG